MIWLLAEGRPKVRGRSVSPLHGVQVRRVDLIDAGMGDARLGCPIGVFRDLRVRYDVMRGEEWGVA